MKNVRLRLGAKFGLVLGALAAVILIVGVAGISGLGSLRSETTKVGTSVNEGNRDGEVTSFTEVPTLVVSDLSEPRPPRSEPR